MERVPVDCIFCGKSESSKLIEENGFVGRKCLSCSLIFISPRPTLEEIINLYGHNEAHESAQSHIAFKYGKTLYAKHTLNIIEKYFRRGDMLEIGAGAGYFLEAARKRGFGVYALEFNELQAKYMTENLQIPCEQKVLSKNTFEGKKFQSIYHCDVLSHFYEPIEEFIKMREKLEPSGYLIFETGNLGDVHPKYLKWFSKFQYPDHLFFFSEDNIKMLLDKSGFELVAMHRYSILPQLMAKRAVGKITSWIKPRIKMESGISGMYAKLFHKIRRNLKNTYSYFYFVLRYKFGKIALKKARPQTMIVVARAK